MYDFDSHQRDEPLKTSVDDTLSLTLTLAQHEWSSEARHVKKTQSVTWLSNLKPVTLQIIQRCLYKIEWQWGTNFKAIKITICETPIEVEFYSSQNFDRC